MAISLEKGASASLAGAAPGVANIIIGLGWEPRPGDGAVFDLDASAFLLRGDGKVRGDGDFIFYNNLGADDGSVAHTGDSRTGVGGGDDERISVDLARIAPEIERVVFAATVHEAEARKHNFGMVARAFIRCLDAASERELVRYDLSADWSAETAMVFGELWRSSDGWQFRAVGQGFRGELATLARAYGVDA